MRKLILMVAATALALVANAQQPVDQNGGQAPQQREHKPVDPKIRATQQTERMAKAIGFDESTKAKVYALNYDAAQKMVDLKAKYPNDRKAIGRERMKLKTDHDCQLKSTLTPEQYDKWIDLKMEQRHKHKQMKKGLHQAHPQRKAPLIEGQ